MSKRTAYALVRSGGGRRVVHMKSSATPRPVLLKGAVYWSDGGRRICVRCAGTSALYTGRDLSGQRVDRVTAADVCGWPDEFGPMRCEARCTHLSPVVGADGWPLATGGVA